MCNNSKKDEWRWKDAKISLLRQKAIMNERAIRKKGYNDGKGKGKKLIKEGKDIKYITELTGIDEKEIKELITNIYDKI